MTRSTTRMITHTAIATVAPVEEKNLVWSNEEIVCIIVLQLPYDIIKFKFLLIQTIKF